MVKWGSRWLKWDESILGSSTRVFLRDSSHPHSGAEDCETMRVVSSCWFSRIEDYEPMRMVTACLHSEIGDCERMHMVSAYRFSSIE